MSAALHSQNLSAEDSICISIAEMDTISVKLHRLQTLEQYTSLLELNVKDLKLARETSKALIIDLNTKVNNQDIIIRDYQLKEVEYKRVIENEQKICTIEKRQIRKRWVLIGSSGTVGGLLLGFVFGLLLN